MDDTTTTKGQELFEYIKENELFDGNQIVTPTRPVRLTQTEFEGYSTEDIIHAVHLLNTHLCHIWGFVTDRGDDHVASIRCMTPWEREKRYKEANPKRWKEKRLGQLRRRRRREKLQKTEDINKTASQFLEF